MGDWIDFENPASVIYATALIAALLIVSGLFQGWAERRGWTGDLQKRSRWRWPRA